MTLEEVMQRVKDQKYVGKVMGMEADLNDEINSELKYLKELQSLREDFKVFKRALELACNELVKYDCCEGLIKHKCDGDCIPHWKEYFLKKAGEEIEEE